ncbi:MAG: hypothetical protein GEV08_08120 [Acidimicrobiia bacterium]|nr:hypothetical protein [Acidimicrobiia bacterium]
MRTSRAVVLVGLLGAAGSAAWAVRRQWSRGGRRRSTVVPGVDRPTLEGLAAELCLRGVDARVERSLDLTVEPGIERYVLDYPERDERRLQRQLALLLAPRGAPPRLSSPG